MSGNAHTSQSYLLLQQARAEVEAHNRAVELAELRKEVSRADDARAEAVAQMEAALNAAWQVELEQAQVCACVCECVCVAEVCLDVFVLMVSLWCSDGGSVECCVAGGAGASTGVCQRFMTVTHSVSV